jgi:hypothetical protein
LHYFRLPSKQLWRDRLEKICAAGLNAVELCYPWSYHSQGPGDYDFGGIRDVDALHAMIEEMGLFLIARPGPHLGAEIDLGGLPAWLLRDRSMISHCHDQGRLGFSAPFLESTREWFRQILPRVAGCSHLILVKVEKGVSVPGPFTRISRDLWDLVLRYLTTPTLPGFGRGHATRGRMLPVRSGRSDVFRDGHDNAFVKRIRGLMGEFNLRVPVFHDDGSPSAAEQAASELRALDRCPITRIDRDWRDDPGTFDALSGDEAATDTHRPGHPVFYSRLQAGWHDGWSGPGYEWMRGLMGSESIDNLTKAALAQRATLWCYSAFCGGTTWGYMSSPDVYSSYDCSAPIRESGRTGDRYQAVLRLNQFIDRFEQDLVETERLDPTIHGTWCPEHLVTRQGPQRRFVFLRNPTRVGLHVPTPEADRAELAPWETQIRVYGADGRLVGISPVPVRWARSTPGSSSPLPQLETWHFSGGSPQLEPAYDDTSWTEISKRDIERDWIDIDSLGVHYGFIWYRGTFREPLDRLLLDARHCYSVWINRELIAVGDQVQDRLGVGPDAARTRRIPLRGVLRDPVVQERNVIVILVESLGHNQGLSDLGANPRGIVRLDTGMTPIRWRYRGGLLRGERGMNPVVAFGAVERTGSETVSLPHGWEGEPSGVGLYETRFRLEGLDPKHVSLGLAFDPGRCKANLYLNGYLIGRYWPERGPQSRFPLPWGVLDRHQENHLAIAVWKRSPRAALGKVRLEVM